MGNATNKINYGGLARVLAWTLTHIDGWLGIAVVTFIRLLSNITAILLGICILYLPNGKISVFMWLILWAENTWATP